MLLGERVERLDSRLRELAVRVTVRPQIFEACEKFRLTIGQHFDHKVAEIFHRVTSCGAQRSPNSSSQHALMRIARRPMPMRACLSEWFLQDA
jgi:hypothetical protein